MIRHVVLLRFTDPADAPEARSRLEAMGGQVPELLSLRAELDVLRSEASFDLCLETTHTDLAGLKGYQEHPAHTELLGWLRPRLSGRATVDSEF